MSTSGDERVDPASPEAKERPRTSRPVPAIRMRTPIVEAQRAEIVERTAHGESARSVGAAVDAHPRTVERIISERREEIERRRVELTEEAIARVAPQWGDRLDALMAGVTPDSRDGAQRMRVAAEIVGVISRAPSVHIGDVTTVQVLDQSRHVAIGGLGDADAASRLRELERSLGLGG